MFDIITLSWHFHCCIYICDVVILYVLICSVLFWYVLFYSDLFCSVLFCSVLFCSVLFCSDMFCSILFCSVLICSVLYYIRKQSSIWNVSGQHSVFLFSQHTRTVVSGTQARFHIQFKSKLAINPALICDDIWTIKRNFAIGHILGDSLSESFPKQW